MRQLISIQELLNPVRADDCTQSVTNMDLQLVESISYESGNESDPGEATGDELESLLSSNEQLSSLALTKRIAECAGIDNPKFCRLMRKIQRFVRLQVSQSATRTALDIFFNCMYVLYDKIWFEDPPD